MIRLVEMDRNVTLSQQLEDTGGPVILVNQFNVDAAEADRFLEAWADDAAYFKRQPGFISTQLHRGIAGSRLAVLDACGHWPFVERRAEFVEAVTAFLGLEGRSKHRRT